MTPESAVRQLAASLLAKEITQEFLTTLMEPATASLLIQLEPSCADLLGKQWSADDYEEASVEYCRLFIVNPVVPARAAAYFEEQELEIASRIQFMLDNGFLELPEKFQNLAPDHVATLLLIRTSIEGEDEAQFTADNITPWIPRFAEALLEKTTHPIYRLAARLVMI